MSFKAVADRGRQFLGPYLASRIDQRLVRYLTIGTVSLISKFLSKKYFDTKATGVDRFSEVYDTARVESRGLMTVMNHVSVLDEPLVWGVLPYRQYKPQTMRWTLGADNICFRTRSRSFFFRMGQVLSTKRFGVGPFQGAIDGAIQLLSSNSDEYLAKHPRVVKDGTRSPPNWVHVFPESFVHQPMEPHKNTLRYFHWGISRIILESTKPPIILPIFIDGLQDVFPEDHSKMRNVFQLYKSKSCVSYGKPLDDDAIAAFRKRWADLVEADGADVQDDLSENLKFGQAAQDLRSEVARYVRTGLENHRQSLGYKPEDPRLGEAEFWHLSEEERGLKVMKNDHKMNPDVIEGKDTSS